MAKYFGGGYKGAASLPPPLRCRLVSFVSVVCLIAQYKCKNH